MSRVGLVRAGHDGAILDLKTTQDILGRHGATGCRCSLINDVDPAVTEPLSFSLEPRLLQGLSLDHLVEEIDELPVSSEEVRRDDLARLERPRQNAHNGFRGEPVGKGELGLYQRDVVLRPSWRLHCADEDLRFGHGALLSRLSLPKASLDIRLPNLPAVNIQSGQPAATVAIRVD